MRRQLIAVAGLLAAGLLAGDLPKKHEHGKSAGRPPGRPASEIRGPVGGRSYVPTPGFDPQGRLWVTWVESGRVWVSVSEDGGRTFRQATPVSPEPSAIDDNGEGRPKLAFGPGGQIYLSWTKRLEKPYTGHILFSRSTDGGKTFSAPRIVNDDRTETGHRFDTLVVARDGRIAVVWVDKRDRDAAPAGSKKLPGASLYAAWSEDGGQTFGKNFRVDETACECCRIAAVPEADGSIAIFYRDVLAGSIRDHTVLRFAERGIQGDGRRATFDDWKLDGCPHHGPAMAMGPGARWHLAWWTGEGRMGRGLFYARSQDGGATTTKPLKIGSDRAAHPALAAAGDAVVIAWIDYPAGAGARVMTSVSKDAGASWSPAAALLGTRSESDHPQLAVRGDGVYLTWFTEAEGLRVLRVGA